MFLMVPAVKSKRRYLKGIFTQGEFVAEIPAIGLQKSTHILNNPMQMRGTDYIFTLNLPHVNTP